ncbi:TIR domain-containing protein [Marinobacterium marinum]|uniref:Nucleotide-binding protein n=1 Tax=Marinobacterium marinum TaxID=2756129 RepID=A0A7W2AAD6_9GAMM|nr:nucleotide-binding protein [Marinobacterium marinum]MBA4500880.1 nucleotide-binding protein [Marinobacterium marinum]
MSQDLFKEINHAVLDLQGAQLQTYERPLKRLVSLLQHPDLETYNAELTEGLDLETFLEESARTGGSMVGSQRLLWPDSAEECLGLTFLLLQKMGEDPAYAATFAHDFYYSGSKIIAGIHSLTGQLIIPFIRDYKSYTQSKGSALVALQDVRSRKVFIVHGHDEGAREMVARFLEKIDFEPVILHEQANQGRTVIEKVEKHGDVGFAVVLLTPDDEGSVKGGNLQTRPRQNVLLELGYFIGRLSRDRVCTLKRGELEIPSDFAGVVWEDMDAAGGWKQSLARELNAAGYSIDWNVVMR